MPIEFARISRDGRLTLVINPGSTPVQTYWALSGFATLDKARENLRDREGCALDATHSVVTGTNALAGSGTEGSVQTWLAGHKDLDAAVWTALETNWDDVKNESFTPENAVRYLSQLQLEKDENAERYRRACEYIQNAPEQIRTKVREALSKKHDFKDASLPSILFESDRVDRPND